MQFKKKNKNKCQDAGMGEQIKSSLLLTLLQSVYSYFRFHLPAIHLYLTILEKNYYDMIILLHVSFGYYRKHPNNDVMRFVPYYLLLISNSTFMTDSQYSGTIQI